jgi:FtsP/CotA-like multicopper oxidase with cupredoxin domain
MSLTRRNMIQQAATALVAGVAAAGTGGLAFADGSRETPTRASGEIKPAWTKPALAPGVAGTDYKPVHTPNGATLPFKVVNGAKVFHLIVEEVDHEFTKGLKAKCWGFNGRVHGPTLEMVEGDHVRIYVTNNLPAATSIHWHAIILPNGMDGIAGLTQKEIKPGATFKYEFTVQQHGTFMYHSHHDEMTQIAMGLMGMLIIHPRNPKVIPDRDYAIMLSEWRIIPGTYRPVTTEMTDFNMFTMNGISFPDTEPILAKVGDRVRIRIGNLSPMDHHPIHIHGHSFRVIATDGGDIPESAQWPETTILVPVGSTRTIEFIADNPGDWLMHCHMTHHMMNQMGHAVANLIGVDTGDLDTKVQSLLPKYMTMGVTGMGEMADAEAMAAMPGMEDMAMPGPENTASMIWKNAPFGAIPMGGMTTVVKIRHEITDESGKSWYKSPPEQVAKKATKEDLEQDGIKTGV